MLVGWVLGKEILGLYGVLQGAMLLIAQLSDFGLNTTTIKHYRDLETDGRRSDAEALLRATLWLRLAIVAVIAGLCLVLARPIAERLLNVDAGVGDVMQSSLAVLVQALAKQKFNGWRRVLWQ